MVLTHKTYASKRTAKIRFFSESITNLKNFMFIPCANTHPIISKSTPRCPFHLHSVSILCQFCLGPISHIETNRKHKTMHNGCISQVRDGRGVNVVLIKRAGAVAPALKVYRFTLASKAWRISFLCSKRRTSSSSLFSGIYDSGRVTCPKLI